MHCCKNVILARLLLESGADPNIQDEEGNTPLSVRVSGIKGEIDYSIIRCHAYGADYDSPPEAGIKIIKLLLLHGANPNIQNKEGDTSLNCCENAEIERLLLENGAVMQTVLKQTGSSAQQGEAPPASTASFFSPQKSSKHSHQATSPHEQQTHHPKNTGSKPKAL